MVSKVFCVLHLNFVLDVMHDLGMIELCYVQFTIIQPKDKTVRSKIFEGDRIRLAAVTDDDVPIVANWLSDLGLQRLVNPGSVVPMTAEQLLDPNGWFAAERRNKVAHLFAVRTKSENLLIGISALNNINLYAHYAEIGINLGHPEYQGKGYGSDVMLTTMRFGFERLNLNRIWLRVFDYNTRAIRLYEKLGFVHEVREREMIYRDGRYYDNLLMGILRYEWEEHYG